MSEQQRAGARVAARRARHRASRALRRERRRRPLPRPPADALRPLLAAERLEPARAARRARQPGARQALPRRRAADVRRRDRSPDRASSSRRRGAPTRSASSSSTSSTATATSGTSCSARAIATGKYGGSLENRTRFLTRVADGIRAAVPGLGIGVRLSVDRQRAVPQDRRRSGRAGDAAVRLSPRLWRHRRTSGASIARSTMDARSCGVLRSRGIRWVCLTAGSPYYCPHVVRPALFPPADGYEPPEDPLHGVARQITRHGDAQVGVSRHGVRRVRPTPTSRSGCRTSGSTRCATA